MDKIILGDHEEIFRIGVSKALTGADNFRIVAQCADLESLLLAVKAHRTSIVVFSSNLTSDYGSVVAQIKMAKSHAVVIAEPGEPSQRFTAHGVRGVIYRDVPGPALLGCIEDVFRGHSSIPPLPVMTTSEWDDRMPQLTPRESEIVAQLAQGCRNKEIAGRLGITEQVVRNHLLRICRKAGVSDRVKLTLLATGNEMGFVEAQPRTSVAKGR
jgi:DNA-binding NarL/FixJ family response regulator